MPPCDQFPECHSVPTPFRQLLGAVFIISVRKKRVTSIEPLVQFPPPERAIRGTPDTDLPIREDGRHILRAMRPMERQ